MSLNIAVVLKRCQVANLVKRVVKTHELDGNAYLLCEARSGQWVLVASEADGFDVIFRDTEAEAIAWAPKAVQRGWT